MISSLSLLPNLSFFPVFLFQWLMISDCKKLKTCIRLSISLLPFLFISHQMPKSFCQVCHFNSFRIRPSSYPFLQFFIISCITLNSPVSLSSLPVPLFPSPASMFPGQCCQSHHVTVFLRQSIVFSFYLFIFSLGSSLFA